MPKEMTQDKKDNKNRYYSRDLGFVIASGVLFGTLSIFAALLTATGMNALAQVTWRFLLTIPLFLLASVVLKKSSLFTIGSSDAILLLLQGLILFLAGIAFVEAISLGLQANAAGFLGNISPIFAIALQRILFKERIGWRKVLAAMLSLLGVALLLLGGGGRISLGSSSYLPGLVALTSSFFFGTFVVMNGKFSHSLKYNSVSILFWSFVGAAVCSAVTALILGSIPTIVAGSVGFIVPHFSTYQWGLLGGFSLFSASIPYLLLTLGERTVTATTASITLLLAPISTVVMSIFILGEFLNLLQILGGLLVMIGIIFVGKSR